MQGLAGGTGDARDRVFTRACTGGLGGVGVSLGSFQKQRSRERVVGPGQQRPQPPPVLLLVLRALHPVLHRHHGGLRAVLLHPDAHGRAGGQRRAAGHQHRHRQPGAEVGGEPAGDPFRRLVAAAEGAERGHPRLPGKPGAVAGRWQSLLGAEGTLGKLLGGASPATLDWSQWLDFTKE